jgi:hypothetical protein
MTAKQVEQTEFPGPSVPIAPEKADQQRDSGQPGGGKGRVDNTGIVPENVQVDPDITEGHPGYQESGDSEIIPAQRLAGKQSAGG